MYCTRRTIAIVTLFLLVSIPATIYAQPFTWNTYYNTTVNQNGTVIDMQGTYAAARSLEAIPVGETVYADLFIDQSTLGSSMYYVGFGLTAVTGRIYNFGDIDYNSACLITATYAQVRAINTYNQIQTSQTLGSGVNGCHISIERTTTEAIIRESGNEIHRFTVSSGLTLYMATYNQSSSALPSRVENISLGTPTPANESSADLSVSISAPSSVTVNNNFTVSVTVTNTGTDTANFIDLTDYLGSGLSYVSYSASAGIYYSGIRLWSINSLSNGSSATLTLTLKATQTGTRTYQVTSTTVDQPDDPDVSNNTATVTINATSPSTDVGLINWTVNNSNPTENTNVTLTVTFQNQTSTTLTAVNLNSFLPSGMQYVSHSGGNYTSSTGAWSFTGLSLGLYQSYSASITAKVIANSGTLSPSVSFVSSTPTDINSSNNSTRTVYLYPQQAQVTTTDLEVVSLEANKESVVGGDVIMLTATFQNNGSLAINNFSLNVSLPVGASYETQVGGTSYSSNQWNFGYLASGGTLTGKLFIMASGQGTVSVSYASSSPSDDDASNNTASFYYSADEGCDIVGTPNLEAVWLGSSTTDIAYRTGNVGIGVSNPTQKLEVNGTARAKEVVVEHINWPDYVFESGYDLPSLSELASYIKEKGHLPNIPSAEEVAKDGLSLGMMQGKLLEKIEELTLHLIEREEQLTQQAQLLEAQSRYITEIERTHDELVVLIQTLEEAYEALQRKYASGNK